MIDDDAPHRPFSSTPRRLTFSATPPVVSTTSSRLRSSSSAGFSSASTAPSLFSSVFRSVMVGDRRPDVDDSTSLPLSTPRTEPRTREENTEQGTVQGKHEHVSTCEEQQGKKAPPSGSRGRSETEIKGGKSEERGQRVEANRGSSLLYVMLLERGVLSPGYRPHQRHSMRESAQRDEEERSRETRVVQGREESGARKSQSSSTKTASFPSFVDAVHRVREEVGNRSRSLAGDEASFSLHDLTSCVSRREDPFASRDVSVSRDVPRTSTEIARPSRGDWDDLLNRSSKSLLSLPTESPYSASPIGFSTPSSGNSSFSQRDRDIALKNLNAFLSASKEDKKFGSTRKQEKSRIESAQFLSSSSLSGLPKSSVSDLSQFLLSASDEDLSQLSLDDLYMLGELISRRISSSTRS